MKLKLYTLVLSGILFNHLAIAGRVPIIDDVSEQDITVNSLGIQTAPSIRVWMEVPESAPPIFHAINQDNVSEVETIMQHLSDSDIDLLTSEITIGMPGGHHQQFTPLDLARALDRNQIINILSNY